MLSAESLPYLIDGMGSTDSGQELIFCIQNASVLSPASMIRLQTCFGENDVATNFQNAILGVQALSPRDMQFAIDGFSMPLMVQTSVFDNIIVATPSFSPPTGAYGPSQSVVISSSTPGASFFYTTDGTTPTTSSTPYTGPVTVSSSETVKAIAVTSGTHNSAVGSATYVINGAVATPTFSPVAGSYVGSQSVTITSATSGATIYYTVDGSMPTRSSIPYTGPVTVATSETVKALGVKTGYSDSSIGSAAYVIS